MKDNFKERNHCGKRDKQGGKQEGVDTQDVPRNELVLTQEMKTTLFSNHGFTDLRYKALMSSVRGKL